ncbi:hypothetical protein PSTG_18912, partial [Puccinia striiformis f. sp. tritici PST-78]
MSKRHHPSVAALKFGGSGVFAVTAPSHSELRRDLISFGWVRMKPSFVRCTVRPIMDSRLVDHLILSTSFKSVSSCRRRSTDEAVTTPSATWMQITPCISLCRRIYKLLSYCD